MKQCHIPSSPSLPGDVPLPSSITNLVSCFTPLFQEPTNLPPSRSITHHIHLFPGSNPVNIRPYRYPHCQKTELKNQVSTILDASLIQLSQSPFSSPVLLVKKKDNNWRFCVYYRALNVITVKDRFPMPTINELLDELGKSSWFSKLDLCQGFHQIRMVEEDMHKMTFRTHQGHYEYKVMPFGLCNVLATFQATMNELLKPFLQKFVLVLFDDILIYSPSLDSHLIPQEVVFTTLSWEQFHLQGLMVILRRINLSYAIRLILH